MTTEQNKINQVIESARTNKTRVRVWYGDTTTGEAWPEEFDIMGYIGRSTGREPIPLLVNNARSMGGGALLVDCIVRIDSTDGRNLYRHPSFSAGNWKITEYTEQGVKVSLNGNFHAMFLNEHKARLYIDFMRGGRYSK